MTFKPDTFRDLANWILVAIGLVLPVLARRLQGLVAKRAPVGATRPSTIYDSGTVTAHASVSGSEALSDGGTIYVKLTPSAVEAIG